MYCKPKCNKDLTLDKWIAQELDIKPIHLDSAVVSSGIPVTFKTNWLKKTITFLSTKNSSRFCLQRYPVFPDINIFLMIQLR